MIKANLANGNINGGQTTDHNDTAKSGKTQHGIKNNNTKVRLN